MRELGFQEFWALNYWGAHWDLPSATQGFEMFHRDIIDGGELDTLLRALDYSPVWRAPLRAIAYNPITRIDLRRMYRTGTFNADQIRRGYLDIGYSPENAGHLVEFVKAEAAGVDIQAPAGAVLRAYRKRLLSAGEARAALRDLDYSDDAISLQLSLEDLALAEERSDLIEDVVRVDYKAGSIDAPRASQQLAAAGLPPDRIVLLIDLWTVQKAPRVVTLSAAEVQRAFREGIITEAAGRGRLRDQGYNEEDVAIKIALARPEPAPPEVRELTVAQLAAATRRGFLSSFITVRDAIDDAIEAGLTTRTETEAFFAELTLRHFTDVDAWVIVALTFPEPEEPPPVRERTLTAAQVLRALKDGIIGEPEAVGRLSEMGYDERDVAILIFQTLGNGGA
jgi:hypothetical protein